MFPVPIHEDARFKRMLYMAGVVTLLLVWLMPLMAITMTSIRSTQDIMSGNYWGWPTEFSMVENYGKVFTQTAMLQYFRNSLIITIPTVLAVLVLSTLTGFVLSKYRFRGATLLFALFVGGNFLPHQILMIPVRDLMVNAGIYDTFWALIIFHAAFQTGFATLFMRNFIASLPHELFEAAKAEGVSPLQVLLYIVVPLLRPALAALAVLTFTFVWNDYFWAVVLTQTDAVKPVTAGLANLKGEWVAAWNIVSAATMIAAIPPVTMFFLMQKHFIAGLTAGAVKG